MWDVLPTRRAGAAENMATDFLLLQRYPAQGRARFRHYGWNEPAFTFGYSQKWAFIRTQLPEGQLDVCRRATGGGVVDHREDWTYCLVMPRGHALEEMRASQSYRAVHEAVVRALVAQGADARINAVAEPKEEAAPAGVCFERAELYDVVRSDGMKIAGAAQKRAKRGILFQGSIWRPAVKADLDWDVFGEAFVAALGELIGSAGQATPWPEFAEGELDALSEQYRSSEWLEYR